MTKDKAIKIDPALLMLGTMASKEAMLEDVAGRRSFALARILDKYELWHVRVEEGGKEIEIPWGQELYMTLQAWEILSHGESLGREFSLGLKLKPEKPISLEEALRRLGL